MKTVDLRNEQHSLSDLFTLAKAEALFIHSTSGEDFILEPANDFDREAVSFGDSEKFMSFLETRSKEDGDIPMSEIRKKHIL